MGEITIGQLAHRTGVAVSALRYYETLGILSPNRTANGQRRYPKRDIRKVSFLIAAQRFGYTLPRIADMLSGLPEGRAPNAADWTQISDGFAADLDAQIAQLQKLRSNLDGCIGCGCLSLEKCALYNPGDEAAERGPGPRFVMGDKPKRRPDPAIWRPAQKVRVKVLGLAWRDGRLLAADVPDDSGAVKGVRPLGGTVEFGEHTEDALRREFREELGAEITINGAPRVVENLFTHEGAQGHEVLFLYDIALPQGAFAGQEEIPFTEDGGTPCLARWHALTDLDRPGAPALYPDGLGALLKDQARSR